MIRRGLVAALMLAGCSIGTGSEGAITVYAAASLRDAFEELAAAFTEEHGVDIELSFDASSALRAQIEEGAPADVFASADLVNAQTLVDAGRTRGPSRTFAANALTIVVPAGNPSGIDRWTALSQPGVRIIAAGEDVPITRYASDMVNELAAQADAPSGFAAAYEENIVSREDNVRAILAKIEIGEGDAAIVYETDARSSADVAEIAVPEDAQIIAEYAAVTLTDASSAAPEFVTWLLGDAAQAILVGHGFRPPPEG